MRRLRAIWHLLNMSCEEMTFLASESLDRDLDRLERLTLRTHLLYCIACRRYSQQIEFLRCAMCRIAHGLEAAECSAAAGLPEEVCQRIKRAIKTD